MRTLKESNVSFIGRIPENWVVGKVKFYYDLQTGFTPDTKIEKYYSNNGEGFDWVTIADIPKVKIISNQTLSQISKKYIDEKHPIATPKGSLLYSFKLSIGQVAFTDREIYTNEAIASFLPNDKVSLDYLYYSSSLIINNAQENIYGAMLLNQDLIRKAVVPIPPLAEQKQIATYLDARCSKIDGAIAQRKAIIEKLKEYKSAVITKAVTKGLNPDIEMKDSGIDWIGKVPKHWICTVLKRYCKFKTGTTPSTKEEKWFDGDIQWFTPADCHSMLLTNSERTLTVKAVEDNNLMLVPRNTVLIVGIGATAGNVGITECESYFNQQMTAMLANKELIPQYLLYWIVANSKFLRETAPYTTLPILNNNTLSYYDLLVPPIVEQQNIIKYLDSQCAKIDEAIAKQEQAVAKLEEYRKSIIYYAVTGKIDCSNI